MQILKCLHFSKEILGFEIIRGYTYKDYNTSDTSDLLLALLGVIGLLGIKKKR